MPEIPPTASPNIAELRATQMLLGNAQDSLGETSHAGTIAANLLRQDSYGPNNIYYEGQFTKARTEASAYITAAARVGGNALGDALRGTLQGDISTLDGLSPLPGVGDRVNAIATHVTTAQSAIGAAIASYRPPVTEPTPKYW